MSQNDQKSKTSIHANDNANRPMSEDELDGIAAAGYIRGDQNSNFLTGTDGNDMMYGEGGNDMLHGGDGNDYLRGDDGNDILNGGDGHDRLYGDDGNDALFGGAGNDILDGGNRDGADDVASGGAGDDMYLWRVSGEGNDTFYGDEGNDTIKLWDLGSGTLESVWQAGNFNISLEDADGNEIPVTADMFNDRGDLILPAGCSGVITGPDGETLTFEGVEIITKYYS